MNDLLRRYLARARVPGAAVCTFDSAGHIEPVCAGVADTESRTPVRPTTMFRIYSLTKLMTACAVAGLARRGRVDLDEPLDAVIDGLTRRTGGPARAATARQALSHTGGTLPDALTWAPLGRNDADLRADIVRDYARAFSFAEPGRHYGYSNAGFNLAAVLIEQATGLPFGAAMRSLLYDPLDMPHTTHDPAVAMTHPLAQHHRQDASVIHRPLAGSKWLAGSQCYSTPVETARFGSWLLRGLREGADVPGLVARPVADLRLDVGTRYGLGCYLTRGGAGSTVVGHEGFFDGMWVKLVVDPALDRGLVWMDNRGDEVRQARYEVIEKLMPGILPPDTDPAPAPEAAAAAAGAAGRYHRTGSPDLRLEADGPRLVATLDGRSRTLAPFSPGLWRAPASSQDTGPWRPHAGSDHVCLGVAEPDPDGTRVAHLNALPHSKRPVA
ncbi:serine hydrolase domain-containing protein [Spirillospora sp. NPDC127200]